MLFGFPMATQSLVSSVMLPFCSVLPQLSRLAWMGMIGSLGVLTAMAATEGPGYSSTPLAKPQGTAGGPLFREMSAAETGVVSENLYADPRMWGDRYQEFALGGMGTGVAIETSTTTGARISWW